MKLLLKLLSSHMKPLAHRCSIRDCKESVERRDESGAIGITISPSCSLLVTDSVSNYKTAKSNKYPGRHNTVLRPVTSTNFRSPDTSPLKLHVCLESPIPILIGIEHFKFSTENQLISS